jgi:hypothetical protein
MVKKTESAFKWIVGILRGNEIPFQISGGFAARLYGSTRPLFDIDIDIPERCFETIIPDIKDFIVFGPKRFRDDSWDLLLITLKYENQEIDISGCDTINLFNPEKQLWIPYPENLDDVEEMEVYGENCPIITKKHLIEYKNIIKRPTDLDDIAMISNSADSSKLTLSS